MENFHPRTKLKIQEVIPYWVWHNAPVGPALKSYFPEVDKIVQFSGSSDILLTDGENSYQEEGVFFMDSTVFDVFSWKVLKGDPKTALTAPYSMVMTESTAKRYFGNEDPIGKTLKGSDSPGRSNAAGIIQSQQSSKIFLPILTLPSTCCFP
jgi:putative ABC transport system permease protein